ncbi:hypothetical protein AB0L06_41865 [Spirillospora sp. NPDC052269]
MARPVRQIIIAIYPATFPCPPDWPKGPLPLSHQDVIADTVGRSTYYPARTSQLLFGTADRPRRWHKFVHQPDGDVTVLGLEALSPDTHPNATGLVIAHLSVRTTHPLDVVRSLSRRRGTTTGFTPQPFLDGQARVRPEAVPYTLAFVTSDGRRLPRIYRHPRYLRWSCQDQWLWALATRTNCTDIPPDRPSTRVPAGERIWLSADWCGLVLRDGAALLATRPDRGEHDRFYNHAALYAQTIYLDALLIGLLQLHGISTLEDALADALAHDHTRTLPELERQLTTFRNRLWWQHLTTSGTPNAILDALHRHHRLPARFDQILAEINDLNRLSRENENRHVNSAIVLFTLVTVPVGIALALLQALGSQDLWLFVSVLTTAALVTGLLLLTRPARLVITSIRQRLTP